jgi:DNA-binding NtrC family response regulator
MRCLEEHAWPGNVRELENVLERSFLFSEGSVIQRISFDLAPRLGHVPVNETADLRQLKKNAADEVERRVLESLQEQTNGDVRAMAAALNLTQRAIYQKLSHHGLGTAREAKS